MTGSCRRLLAIRLLIFVALILVAPTVSRGQDGADRRRTGDQTAPDLPAVRYPLPSTPLWIAPSDLRGPYPAAPVITSLQRDVFQQLVHAAGIIFSGRVTFVGRESSSAPNQASTAVTFQVEHAMRGAAVGQSLTVHEWAGLWNSGERYRVGEHVLLFLYAPSRLGLTSPVSGALGRFAVDSRGMIVMSPQQIATFNTHPMLGGKTVVSYVDFAVAVRRVQPEGMNRP